MGTETHVCQRKRVHHSRYNVKLNNPLMGTETLLKNNQL